MADSARDRLSRGVEGLGLSLDGSVITQLVDYLALLERWNASFNLTAVRDPLVMVTRHLLDSLAIAAHIDGQRFLDVGTGPGLPGIPLALIFPQRQFDLLDSNGKKTRFLFQVKTQLGLTNINVIAERAEKYRPQKAYDAVTTRAFADLGETCRVCGHLVRTNGHLYAMKAVASEAEVAQIVNPFELESRIELTVPGLDEARALVVLRRGD